MDQGGLHETFKYIQLFISESEDEDFVKSMNKFIGASKL